MADARKKPFRLRPEEIVPIAPDLGACFATDMITCEGRKVAFMYREAPDQEVDSGWRFSAGQESDEYMNDPGNHAIYDVNTIANYDPDIVPFLNAPIGSAFERENGVGAFVEVHDFTPPGDEDESPPPRGKSPRGILGFIRGLFGGGGGGGGAPGAGGAGAS